MLGRCWPTRVFRNTRNNHDTLASRRLFRRVQDVSGNPSGNTVRAENIRVANAACTGEKIEAKISKNCAIPRQWNGIILVRYRFSLAYFYTLLATNATNAIHVYLTFRWRNRDLCVYLVWSTIFGDRTSGRREIRGILLEPGRVFFEWSLEGLGKFRSNYQRRDLL